MVNSSDHKDLQPGPAGKNKQWLKLDACINRILDGDQGLCGVLVSGYPGIGKTHLIENYLKQFAGYPVLVARHHQQHSGIPYFGLKQTIPEFLTTTYNRLPRHEFRKFSAQLKNSFGDSFPLFLEYIPEVSLIIGEDHDLSQKYTLQIENQLFSLFKTFFSFLYSYYKRPVFFFTDDLQWMDTSGVDLLKYLLLQLSPDRLVWLAACREHRYNAYPYYHLVEELGFGKKHVESIHLTEITFREAKKVIEERLGNPCHRNLARVCYELCGGNPSYLQVLAESLRDSDHIWLKDGVWHCEPQAVHDRYKGQRTEKILFDRLKEIRPEAREMLFVMACLGGFNRRVLIDWLAGDEPQLKGLLDDAREAGFLVKEGDTYKFSEVHIGEMIYDNLEPDKKSRLHYTIAQLLYAVGLDHLNVTQIVLMTTQFNQSPDLVRAGNETRMCAELNYLAGNYSKQDNAFTQAQYFFKTSADLLKECPWDQVSDEVYRVYTELARTEYQLEEYDLAEIHLDYLLEHVTDAIKRASVFELKVVINSHLGRYRKVVHILKECLRELGVDLPMEEDRLADEVKRLKELLQEKQQDQPQQVVPDHDLARQKAVLKLLYVGGMSLHHTSDVLMTWAALQIITRSGKDPVSGELAIGCVSYGRMLIIGGNIRKGYNFGLRGLQVNNELEDMALRCRVYGVYAFYIQPWKKPFADSLYFMEQGIQAGRKMGDLIGCYILKTHKLNLHLLSGLPLHDLEFLELDDTHPEMELTYYITHYQKSLVSFLLGKSPIFSIPRQKPSRLAAKFTIQEEKFYRNYVWARYYLLFGYYELAESAAREADGNRKLQEGSPLLPANLSTWFLSVTQNWFNYQAAVRPALENRLGEILSQFDLWRRHSPENYEAWYWLLKAEWSGIRNKPQQALTCYRHSIDTAGTNIFQQAVTSEFLGKYLLTLGRRRLASQCIVKAVDLFDRWGALAKVKQLCQQYQAILPRDYQLFHAMDIEMIQHEFSGDLEVKSLVNKLMVLLLRISGSTRVVIERVMDNGDLQRFGDFSLINRSAAEENIPVAMALLAHRSQRTLVVNDLNEEKSLGDISAFQQRGVKSFIMLPVTIRDHLSLVVYLENSFAGNWYNQERIRWVRITANQGAVIIENAHIHEVTVKLNKEIRQEMDEKERLATVIEKQKDLHLHALVQAQDNERKRIASDLHDSLGSLLSSVKMRFNSLQDDVVTRVPEKATRFNTTIALLDEAVDELRRIAHNMLPVSLTRFGLQVALSTFVEQINISEHLRTELQILGLERRLPDQVEIAIYRICQELVQNVLKHAQATFMRIQLVAHEDLLSLIVEDNGAGMTTNAIVWGFGFDTIESKVKFLKGTFSIESQPGKGTMVLVNIPKG